MAVYQEGMTKKMEQRIIRRVLMIYRADPKFEIVLKEAIMENQKYNDIKTYCEVVGIKLVNKKIRMRESFLSELKYVKDRKINWYTGPNNENWVDTQLKKKILNALEEEKEKQRDKKYLQKYKKMQGKAYLQKYTRAFVYLLNNPKAMSEMNSTAIVKYLKMKEGEDEEIIDAIIEGDISPVGTKSQEVLLEKNYEILAKGKDKILEAIDKLNPSEYKDLKALSDIVDTAFKQNRLINNQSTENVAVGVAQMYDAIIGNAQKKEG